MTSLHRSLKNAEATAALGTELALMAKAGSVICLHGDLGAGKTTLARSFIQALAGEEIEVPSPTFTLVQTYDATRIPVAHVDLYRLASAGELDELGLDELLKSHQLIVEWPERLEGSLPADRLDVRLTSKGKAREAELQGHGAWALALRRLAAIADFLKDTDWARATRLFLEGDASFRRYERLMLDGKTAVLMDMAERPDGPVVKNGKPYSAIAHLAENINAVLAVNSFLVERGYSAPRILAARAKEGLAVIEDMGSDVYGRMMLRGDDMTAPLDEAMRLLVDMARREWPAKAPIPNDDWHHVSGYDREAMTIEVELILDWFWPFAKASTPSDKDRREFLDIWHELFALSDTAQPVWIMRDYHSPNLMWLPERSGIKRVGLIDTQDCVLGHPAFDLASLLQDARVDIDFTLADELLDRYCALRKDDPGFDEAGFRSAYAFFGAQRSSKILGIFARLFKRDGKRGYLRHIPRVSRYLERNLGHPRLARLRQWYDRHLPPSLRESLPQ
ncbi:tRNA (adenosine(37)-N6)-threonylcarbamoyltransferase complex ATPase subunit type 1 TsaE [Nordella sp. HKS 07]|uniref:tRNA (adenosine(37)-N6)-threonylcarbamoyltransferase complex ATPase subunit type 1 TsaE n=1 Tax=Nordella sp. HKS 07 TaxID=2712222 RepID=UPI0013E10590|nr:tRNA (adenosine(37)-N6)-threonylcarbamoyltransferase complex ATPase subunit type 1 TsaE [Nordella sp. HKS 07]QIG48680.1 tRNA (adenosine(37)-N6)-threonylcarbamoyltransferase complex ATPase subunit type 1 TsaE [Nordella sp. HKS 07]